MYLICTGSRQHRHQSFTCRALVRYPSPESLATQLKRRGDMPKTPGQSYSVCTLLRTHRQRWGTRSSHRFNLESRSDPVCIYWGRHMPCLLYAQSTNQSICLLCTRASSWLWCIHTARKQTRKPGTSYHHHIRLLSYASRDIHPPLPPHSPCRATNTTTWCRMSSVTLCPAHLYLQDVYDGIPGATCPHTRSSSQAFRRGHGEPRTKSTMARRAKLVGITT